MTFTIEDLYLESTYIEEIEQELKARKSALYDAINDLLEDNIEKRIKLKPYGVAHDYVDGFKVTTNIDKKVLWDNEKLMRIYETLKNPDDYINVKMDVSESKYKAWPKELQDKFIDARTVKPGSMKITIKKDA